MTTQTQYRSRATDTLEQSKCYICGQPAVEEIKQFQMHFCQRHLAELLQKIMDWANNETFYRESYQNYTKNKEIKR